MKERIQQSVLLEYEPATWSPAKAQNELKERFSGPNSYFILETGKDVTLSEFEEFDFAKLDSALSLRVFSDTAEARLERETTDDEFEVLILTEGSGDEHHWQESRYLLRDKFAQAVGAGLLVCREYFCFDKDGMAWPVLERLVRAEKESGKGGA